ncbi:lamin tail domain-containing protein [Polaribacter porphyrae]|uniref:LTD domain-containing protein n=1 Tax=Polaribacter porphyrae TaxID=1137780 RepID=A0A2S7WR06_9FLAO|nr:lamin tail domain-containing protein [Polaribacter porphyrae]PQJ79711.1 hypothetical protein BTO18_11245 [Polaribacter porphyrae]
MKKFYLLFLFSIICATTSAQLVLNEAHYDPATDISGDANGDGTRSSDNDEFLEFVNSNSTPLDITGYKISDETADGVTKTLRHVVGDTNGDDVADVTVIIPAGGVYVIFGGGDVSTINALPNTTAETCSSLSLLNSGDKVIVDDASDANVITFDPNGSNILDLDTGDNQSLERLPAITGRFIKHNAINGANFSPGVLQSSVTNILVLNEIHADPASDITGDADGNGTRDASNDEFLEFVNNSGASINLNGYKLYDIDGINSDTPSHTFGATTIAQGEALVLFNDAAVPTGGFGGATVLTCSSGFTLFNGGQTIYIKDASDNIVFVHQYGSATNNQSINRSPEITGDTFVEHTTLTGSNNFSPGFQADGTTPLTTLTATFENSFNLASGIWDLDANWSKGTKPTSAENVVIPAGRTVTINVNNLEVTNLDVKGTLTIDETHSLKVTGNLIDAGTLNINSGGSLIVEGSSSGNITYNRELTFVAGNLKGWHLTGSPVVGQAYTDAYATTNGLATSATRRGLATYNTASDSWSYLEDDDSNAGTFSPGQGFSLKRGSTTGDISYTGTINTDNAGVNVTLLTTGNRFNVLSNPYASYLSSATFLNGNGSVSDTKTIWVWNQTLGTDGEYEVKTAGENFIVSPGQGFFVQANASGNTNFNFSESNQSNNSGTDTFQKGAGKTEISLWITDGSIKNYNKIFYLDNATKGFDVGYEGELFGATPNKFAIYSHLVSESQGKNFQVQSLPNSDYENMVIPIGLNADANKEITFTTESLNLPTGIKVFLEDKLTNTFTRLDETNSNYKVTLTEKSDGIGRFYLHTKSSVLNTDNLSLEDNISIYKINSSTLRVTGLSEGKASLKLFNILGKQVLNTSFTSKGIKDIDLPNLATGVYIVQLETETGKLNKKITLE